MLNKKIVSENIVQHYNVLCILSEKISQATSLWRIETNFQYYAIIILSTAYNVFGHHSVRFTSFACVVLSYIKLKNWYN